MPDLEQFAEQPAPPEQAADPSPSAATHTNKKIFVFCDGTGNEFADKAPVDEWIKKPWNLKPKVKRRDGNSNVVKLYTALELNAQQVAYYHPGVGTMGDPAKKGLARKWTKLKGLAFGWGFEENVLDAYRYLMQHYNSGDTVYIFGFSRGAYTARALAGLLHGYGLLCRGNEGHLVYAWQEYQDSLKAAHARNVKSSAAGHTIPTNFSFRDTFSHPAFIIHFMGLWDTVSSVGWITTPVRLLHLAQNSSVVVGRHAISIDERRCFYHDNLWGDPIEVQVPPILRDPDPKKREFKQQDILQVWFPGVHSDIGGGYPQCESGLANNALIWMMDEVKKQGVVFDETRRNAVLGLPIKAQDDPKDLTKWVRPLYPKPVSDEPHDSMVMPWWVLEIFPHRFYDRDGQKREKLRIPWGGRRHIPYGSLLHPSVLERMGKGYAPGNFAHGTVATLPLTSATTPDPTALPNPHAKLPPSDRLAQLPGYGLYTFPHRAPWDWREEPIFVFLMKMTLVSIPVLILRVPQTILLHWMALIASKLSPSDVTVYLASWCRPWSAWGKDLPPLGQHTIQAHIALFEAFLEAAILILLWRLLKKSWSLMEDGLVGREFSSDERPGLTPQHTYPASGADHKG